MSLPTRITFKHIKDVLSSAVLGKSVNPVVMGRWSTCPEKNSGLVADYSNEDHCGPCGDQPLIPNKMAQQPIPRKYNSLPYKDMKKYMIMRRRNIHTIPQKRIYSSYVNMESSLFTTRNNNCDSISGDYLAAIPEAMYTEVPIVSMEGSDDDSDDDDNPNQSGGAPIILTPTSYNQ